MWTRRVWKTKASASRKLSRMLFRKRTKTVEYGFIEPLTSSNATKRTGLSRRRRKASRIGVPPVCTLRWITRRKSSRRPCRRAFSRRLRRWRMRAARRSANACSRSISSGSSMWRRSAWASDLRRWRRPRDPRARHRRYRPRPLPDPAARSRRRSVGHFARARAPPPAARSPTARRMPRRSQYASNSSSNRRQSRSQEQSSARRPRRSGSGCATFHRLRRRGLRPRPRAGRARNHCRAAGGRTRPGAGSGARREVGRAAPHRVTPPCRAAAPPPDGGTAR